MLQLALDLLLLLPCRLVTRALGVLLVLQLRVLARVLLARLVTQYESPDRRAS